jgi:hypothetical protein
MNLERSNLNTELQFFVQSELVYVINRLITK